MMPVRALRSFHIWIESCTGRFHSERRCQKSSSVRWLAAALGDDGVGALDGPVHACPLEPSPNDYLATQLHDAGRSTETLFFELGIPYTPSIFPAVVNTFSRLFVLIDVAAQCVHQRFQVALVELLIACVDPWLALGPSR